MTGQGYFQDKVVVVTGAAHGIGRAYAAAFVEEGATVVIADVDAEGAKATASKLGARAHPAAFDVADERSVARLFAEVKERWRRLDALINNAALMLGVEKPFKPFWELSSAEWQRVMGVNAEGVFLCCKHAYPLMASTGGGRIVNITSDAIWHGYAGQLAYFASKGAVAVMTRCLARELGEFNINVNAVAPGMTSSEAVNTSPFLQEVKPLAIEARALKREQFPEDLVGTVLFLCGPGSASITGQSIAVNCGAIMP
jgi:NAD(P)-dependent dehydrogenase (short-subunit alcohol dehydrogenase family)